MHVHPSRRGGVCSPDGNGAATGTAPASALLRHVSSDRWPRWLTIHRLAVTSPLDHVASLPRSYARDSSVSAICATIPAESSDTMPSIRSRNTHGGRRRGRPRPAVHGWAYRPARRAPCPWWRRRPRLSSTAADRRTPSRQHALRGRRPGAAGPPPRRHHRTRRRFGDARHPRVVDGEATVAPPTSPARRSRSCRRSRTAPSSSLSRSISTIRSGPSRSRLSATTPSPVPRRDRSAGSRRATCTRDGRASAPAITLSGALDGSGRRPSSVPVNARSARRAAYDASLAPLRPPSSRPAARRSISAVASCSWLISRARACRAGGAARSSRRGPGTRHR